MRTQLTEVRLPSGQQVTLPVRVPDTTDVGFAEKVVSSEIFSGIQELANLIHRATANLSPDEMELKIGLGFGVSTGGAISFIVDSKTDASIELSLKWNHE